MRTGRTHGSPSNNLLLQESERLKLVQIPTRTRVDACDFSSLQPEGTKRATSVNVELPCLRKDLCAGSISRDVVSFPSELCRRRSGTFAEVARLLRPHLLCPYHRCSNSPGPEQTNMENNNTTKDNNDDTDNDNNNNNKHRYSNNNDHNNDNDDNNDNENDNANYDNNDNNDNHDNDNNDYC